MANFGPKPWTNPFENISIISFFLHLQRRFFALEYHKTHFPDLDCL